MCRKGIRSRNAEASRAVEQPQDVQASHAPPSACEAPVTHGHHHTQHPQKRDALNEEEGANLRFDLLLGYPGQQPPDTLRPS